MPPSAAAQPQVSPAQANMAARQLVLARSVNMIQQIFSQTVNPAQQPNFYIQPRYVGLIKRFYIILSGTINNTDAALALNLTDLGLSNLLSPNAGVQFTDLNNNQRIQTGGWHLAFLDSIKYRKPFAAGYQVETDEMFAAGENFPILSAPATIAHGASAAFRAMYVVPVAYDDDDLRGAIYANVVNATMQLLLTVNPQPFTAAGVDSTFAVMKGTAAANISGLTCTVYQEYLDQLPVGKNGVILPLSDLSTIYELKSTPVPSVPANQDFGFQYPNFRDILSTFSIYDNNTTGDTGRTAGTDINYWALQSANFTNIWKLDPLTQSLATREILSTDLPKGCYYASSRRKPISSVQYGNIELVINASTAGANSLWTLGLEDFSYPNTIAMAGSIQS